MNPEVKCTIEHVMYSYHWKLHLNGRFFAMGNAPTAFLAEEDCRVYWESIRAVPVKVEHLP